MALVKWARDGYGMLERNRVQTHNIEAQCELDAAVFANGAEVGSIVAVDKAAGMIKLEGPVYGLLANAERLPDPLHAGLKNYHVKGGDMGVVIFLEKGNTFTTNSLCYDDSVFADKMAVRDAINGGEMVYGVQDATSGNIQLVKEMGDAAVVLHAVKFTTMPDGQDAVKFMVIK